QCPLLEVDPVQVAPDPGPHLDGIDRGRPPGEVRVVGDVPLDRAADGDRQGRCLRRPRGRPGAAGQPDQGDPKPKKENPHRSPPSCVFECVLGSDRGELPCVPEVSANSPRFPFSVATGPSGEPYTAREGGDTSRTYRRGESDTRSEGAARHRGGASSRPG